MPAFKEWAAARVSKRSLRALKSRFNHLADEHGGSFRANGVGSIEAEENSKLYEAIVDDILSHSCAPQRSLEVLEVGCGTGEILARLESRVKSVRGVDISDRMVEICRNRGLEVDLVAQTLPFVDGAFDLVLLYSVLINIDDEAVLETVLAEAFRVTRPRGIIFLGNVPNADLLPFSVHPEPSFRYRLKQLLKDLLKRDRGTEGFRYFAYRPDKFVGYCRRFDVDMFLMKGSLLSGSGLEKIDVVFRRGMQPTV